MVKEIPIIARMVIINEKFEDEEFIRTEEQLYNYSGSEENCEYCLNTTAWD